MTPISLTQSRSADHSAANTARPRTDTRCSRALATVGAVIYNLVTHLAGGIEVTLKETD